MDEIITIDGMLGRSAHREVFLGFAPADLLYAISFADVLDQDTGRGYQRRKLTLHTDAKAQDPQLAIAAELNNDASSP